MRRHHRGVGFNRYLLRHGANFELDIDQDIVADMQINSSLHVGVKRWGIYFEPVRPERQVGQHKLPVGRAHRLEVNAPSFNTYVQTGIDLHVGDNVLINVKLEVGAVTQQVSVEANAAMVSTQETSISEVVDQQRIVELPLNGRQATDLIALSGGANVPPNVASGARSIVSTHDYVSSTPVSISGGQENGNNYLLDGGDHNDSHSNVNLPFPFPDALQEFSVQTSGISARYGLHPYAVVNAATKSGTNQIHGSLFEFVRNGDFNARNFFAATQDTLRRNQFGGTGGGAIVKDRLFIFGGYQGTRTRTAPPGPSAS